MRANTPRLALAAAVLSLLGPSQYSAAQQPADRILYVVVTDRTDRLVTGIEGRYFEVLENGSPRPVTLFDADSPVSVAVVGDGPRPASLAPQDEFIQAPSIAEAVRRLQSSEKPRKVLIVSSTADAAQVPSEIQVFNVSGSTIAQAILRARNSYRIGFASADPQAPVQVRLRQSEFLPQASNFQIRYGLQ